MTKRERRAVFSLDSGWVAMQGCVPEIQAMGNSTLGLAQTPEAPELSGQYVKKREMAGLPCVGDHENQCGSEPARDGGVTANIDVGCYGLIASRLAPTGFAVFVC
jgi:hypothetical protein